MQKTQKCDGGDIYFSNFSGEDFLRGVASGAVRGGIGLLGADFKPLANVFSSMVDSSMSGEEYTIKDALFDIGFGVLFANANTSNILGLEDINILEIAVSSAGDNVGKEGVYEVIEQGSNLINWLSNSSDE